MRLSELLEHLAKDFLDDRTVMVEGAPDKIWGDRVLIRYLNQAEKIFCRQAWVLQDETVAAATVIQLVQDQATYKLHKSILRVLSARLSDTDVPMQRVTWETITPGLGFRPHNGYFDVTTQYVENSGRPHWYSTDRPYRTLRVRSKPDAEAAKLSVMLRVIRMPICDLKVGELTASPEIPEEYHLDLCDYAAGKALSHPNADAESRSRGNELLTEFKAKIKDARRDVRTAEYGPGRTCFGGWAAD